MPPFRTAAIARAPRRLEAGGVDDERRPRRARGRRRATPSWRAEPRGDLAPLRQRVDGRHVRAGPRARDRPLSSPIGPQPRTATTTPSPTECGASAPTQQASGSASTARCGSSPAGSAHERPPRHARPARRRRPAGASRSAARTRRDCPRRRGSARTSPQADERVDRVLRRRRPGRRPRGRARAAARAARDGPGSRAGRSRRSPRARRRARPRPSAGSGSGRSSKRMSRSPYQTSAFIFSRRPIRRAIIGRHRRSTVPPRSPVSSPSRSVCTPLTKTWRRRRRAGSARRSCRARRSAPGRRP